MLGASRPLFSKQMTPHKEILGWDPNQGILGVFLYVYVLFSLLTLGLGALF